MLLFTVGAGKKRRQTPGKQRILRHQPQQQQSKHTRNFLDKCHNLLFYQQLALIEPVSFRISPKSYSRAAAISRKAA